MSVIVLIIGGISNYGSRTVAIGRLGPRARCRSVYVTMRFSSVSFLPLRKISVCSKFGWCRPNVRKFNMVFVIVVSIVNSVGLFVQRVVVVNTVSLMRIMALASLLMLLVTPSVPTSVIITNMAKGMSS